MLTKLLKYDLKWVYKLLIIFYILALVFSIISRALTLIENSFIFDILSKVAMGITISMCVSILINNFTRMLVGFIRNFYKDESYLTHTLPIPKKTIFLSKFLTAIITLFTSVVVILGCLAICYYSPENLQALRGALEIAATAYNSSILGIVLAFSGLIFLQLLFILLVSFAGIIYGNTAKNGKIIASFIYGLVFYFISQILSILLIFVFALFNKEIMNLLFTTTNIISIETVKTIVLFTMAIYLGYVSFYYAFGKKKFEQGVNVD